MMSEYEKLIRELDSLYSKIIQTMADKVMIRQLRDSFEAECKETCDKIQERYMQLEIDYIKTSHNIKD